MPLQATSGAASYDAYGGGTAVEPVYIEQIFSTYLYTGTGAAQTITNGIDLSTKGGLVWLKSRSNAYNNYLCDTTRGITNYLSSNGTGEQNFAATVTDMIASTSTTGFALGTGVTLNGTNNSGATHASWTFRKQPKFFDIQTWTGSGSARTITHNLGSTPGFVIVKRTDTADDWYCGITVFGGSDYLVLNSTAARVTNSTVWNNTAPTSTVFTVGTNAGTNASGGTYVAYLFANNAGGFGLTGTDSVIKTVLVSSAGSGSTTYNLGWEPQFLMFKKTASTSDWFIYDTMRGMAYSTGAATLLADTTAAETTGISVVPTATGFVAALDNSFTYFCLAIRRGPMKTPTTGTSVFEPTAYTGNNASNRVIGSLPAGDSALVFTRNYNDYAYPQTWWNRLMGGNAVRPYNTNAEVNQATTLGWANQVGQLISIGSTNINYGGSPAGNFILYNFKRAPSFMDVVCYTGTGANTTQTHNLGVVPELVIVRARDNTNNWSVYNAVGGAGNLLLLNTTQAYQGGTPVLSPTATTVGFAYNADYLFDCSGSGVTYVAYLFATCAGVSKVGSYTGNGTTQTINCGFTGGARFVLIKCTDSTGDWYVYDTARGMTTLTDPYVRLNTTGAEVATLGSVTTVSTGFALNATILAAINTNAASYIFLAIA